MTKKDKDNLNKRQELSTAQELIRNLEYQRAYDLIVKVGKWLKTKV